MSLIAIEEKMDQQNFLGAHGVHNPGIKEWMRSKKAQHYGDGVEGASEV